MKAFDIYIAFVKFDTGGKSRPVLVLNQGDKIAEVYNITTQYERKSNKIRAKYFPLNDWQQAGLTKPSYVDTNIVNDLPISALIDKKPIGRLTDTDRLRLLEFLIR